MSVDVLTPAVLQYIDHGAFPQSEEVAAADLTAANLQPLLHELRAAQIEAKDEIRRLSQHVAPDIDEWISRAKQLQADILRSRETARQIVAEAEAVRELRSQAEDAGKKVELLEKEVTFSETLTGTLEHVRYANHVLDEVQNAAVLGDVDRALDRLEQADESIAALDGVQTSNAYALLARRAEQLREGVKETATEFWNQLIRIDVEHRTVSVQSRISKTTSGVGTGDLTLGHLVTGLGRINILDGLVSKLAKDLDRSVFKSRMTVEGGGTVPNLTIHGEVLALEGQSENNSSSALFEDLETTLKWLSDHLPAEIGPALSNSLIPSVATRLEEEWLEPAVPLEISEMPAFQELLDRTSALADVIDSLGWQGSNVLRDWVRNAPRIWITKRREALLGSVRDLVFTGLREQKVVERVETQMVSNDDALVGGREGGDDWDSAWDDPDEEFSTPQPPTSQTPDDDEASAWEVEDTEEKSTGDGEEEDAWGWDDGEGNPAQTTSAPAAKASPFSNLNGQKTPQAPTEREMTLRETFTVTGIPDSLIESIQQVVSDAQILAGPEYASSLIAPVSTALYTLPTLALAIYRATAPTAYSKLAVGNMLIYNDASRLSDQLRAWQASQLPASRLRLDNDVKALDQFAKAAYGAEMESQRTILRDLLDGAQGFSNSTTVPFRAECEAAVEQTVHRLRDVHRQWTDTLAPSALLQSVGSLLATVTGKMIAEIEDLPDIGEAESKQLRALCDTLSALKDLFVQSAPGGSGAGDEARDLTFIYCPNWLKFQYLAEILESSLADIKYLWHDGELSLEFEAEEVVGLIEALFADSGLRRQAMAEVRRGGRR